MKHIELTVALIKPHILKNNIAFRNICNEIRKEFLIVKSKELVVTEKLAQCFYNEHQNKFFYNRLKTFMSSGPSLVLILAAENSVQKWRSIMGPTKVFKAIHTHPQSLRGLYGLTDTRNACHGSDGKESAKLEMRLFFPDFCPKDWLKNHRQE